jgi:hypothetical protein
MLPSAEQSSTGKGGQWSTFDRLQPSSGASQGERKSKTARAGPSNTSLPRAFSDFQYFSKTMLTKIPDEELAFFGKAHPYALFKRFQEALLWHSQDLRKALISLSALEQRLKATSRNEGRILLESFMLRWSTRQTGGSQA